MVIAIVVRSLCGMRIQLMTMMMLTGCLGISDDAPELAAPPAAGDMAPLAADPLKEIFDQVDGARNYAQHILALSRSEGFRLVAAIDDEQSGWNCSRDGLCGDNLFPAFDIFSCGSGGGRTFNFQAMLAGVQPALP